MRRKALNIFRILPEILSGRKRICLAITEPSAGSDVRNITTVAEKTADGQHYIVNGEKKISISPITKLVTDSIYWITNGIYSDYFMVNLFYIILVHVLTSSRQPSEQAVLAQTACLCSSFPALKELQPAKLKSEPVG